MENHKKLRVVLLRHGETEGNVKGIVQGQWDTGLTDKGISATLKKADKIKKFSFKAVFCSDLGRTMHTLDLLRTKIAVLPKAVYCKELREIDFGDLTGQRKEDIMPVILSHKANPELPYPNGESGNQFIRRVKGFFEMLKQDFMSEQVLVVTHFGVMETAARQFSGPPIYDPIMIGGLDVWQLTFGKKGFFKREVL